MSSKQLQTLDDPAALLVDKVLESRLAELIGTTPKALEHKRLSGVIPLGVWAMRDASAVQARSLLLTTGSSALSTSPAQTSALMSLSGGSHQKLPKQKPNPSSTYQPAGERRARNRHA